MSVHARPDFDPFATLVHLRADGSALPVTPARGTRHRPVGAASSSG